MVTIGSTRHPLGRLFPQATDLCRDADLIRRRRYGMIEVQDERLQAIHFRLWPKYISLVEIAWAARRTHRRCGNRCWLYYNQPLRFSNFLTLQYVLSTRETTLATLHTALTVLDQIAEIKRTDALLCMVSNRRITDRLLQRYGWQRHCLSRPGRHFIKRFL